MATSDFLYGPGLDTNKTNDFLFGTGPSQQRFDTKTGEQKDALSSLLQSLISQIPGLAGNLGFDLKGQPSFGAGLEALLSQLGGFDPTKTIESFESNVARPAMQQFEEQIIPGLKERVGDMSGGRSGVLDLQAATAGQRLQENLAGQKQEALRSGEESSLNRQSQAINQALKFAQAPQASQSQSYQDLLAGIGMGTGIDTFGIEQVPGKEGNLATLAKIASAIASTL